MHSYQDYNHHMKNFSLRNALYIILISSVVAAALIGVSAVLVGGFNDILGRALWTIFLSVFHSLLALGYVSAQRDNDATTTRFPWFSNALFGSILVSFLLVVFGIWEIISGGIVWNTYQALFILLFALFHTEVILQLRKRHTLIESLVYLNTIFIVVVAGMLLGLIYADGVSLGEAFSRLLGAAAILDGTLTVLIVIIDKMLAPKLPATSAQPLVPGQVAKKQPTPLSNVLIITLAVTIGVIQLFGGFIWVLLF